MELEEKEITPKEGLLLIQSMIETTRHSMSDKSHYFLLWGWAVFIGCTLEYVLMYVHYPRYYYAWLITLVAAGIHIYFVIRDQKNVQVKTYVGEANNYLWTAIGFSYVALAIIFSRAGFQYSFPVYILFYGVGTYVTGRLINFRPMVVGALINFVLAIIAVYLAYQAQVLITALALLTSYIIPGHLLRNRYKKTNSLSYARRTENE